MTLSELFRRVFHPTPKTPSVRNMPQTPPALVQAAETGRQDPALPVSSATPTSTTALPTTCPTAATPASNTPTRTVSTQSPSNHKSSLPRSQQTWNGSASATITPIRSPTVPSRPGVQVSPGRPQMLPNLTSDPASVVTGSTANANGDTSGAANVPKPNTTRAQTTSRSITVNLRSAVTNSLGTNAYKKTPKKGIYTESYSTYCLDWGVLRLWLLRTFAGYEFSDQPSKISDIDHDRYQFATPRPLTQDDKDEIYKLRWDYDHDKETAP